MLQRNTARALLAVATGLASLACSDGPTAPADVPLGVEFALAPGEAARAGDDGLRVTFAAVTEDSRCPMDAFCVQAGRVVAAVTAGRGQPRPFDLSPGEAAVTDGYRLELVRVEPHPSSAEPIPPSRYRATFVVVRP